MRLSRARYPCMITVMAPSGIVDLFGLEEVQIGWYQRVACPDDVPAEHA